MVFIIGYVFGGFSKNPTLVSLTKVAAILVIILFIAANGLLTRFVFSRGVGGKNGWHCTEHKMKLP